MFCRPGGVFDMIEAKMPWLRGREFKIQQDGARPHTGTNTVDELQAGGTGDGWIPIILMQPPNSPDVNINDLGLFSSLKYHVSQICTHCTSREEMIANVIRAFDEYSPDKLEDGLATIIICAVSWVRLAETTINRRIMMAKTQAGDRNFGRSFYYLRWLW